MFSRSSATFQKVCFSLSLVPTHPSTSSDDDDYLLLLSSSSQQRQLANQVFFRNPKALDLRSTEVVESASEDESMGSSAPGKKKRKDR